MPIRRAGFRGALFGGVGDTLQDYAALRLKRREADRLLQQQRAWDVQKMQLEALMKFSDKVQADPLNAHRLIAGAQGNPFLAGFGDNLKNMQPPDEALAAELRAKIQAADSDPLKIPDVQTQAELAGMNTRQLPATAPVQPDASGAPPLDFRPQGGGPAPTAPLGLTSELGQEPPPVDFSPQTPQIAPADDVLAKLKAQFPHNNPLMAGLQGAQQQQRNVLAVGQQDKIKFAGDEAQAKFYGQEAGKHQAGLDYGDAEAEQARNAARLKIPIDAEAEAAKKGAEFDALHTSARQAAEALSRRMNKAGELQAEWTPQMIAHRVEQARLEANNKLLQEARGNQIKEVNEMTNAVIKVMPQWEKVKELSKRVNSEDWETTLAKNPGRYLGGKLGWDADVKELTFLREQIGLGTANSLGGNKGQTSEADRDAMRQLIPAYNDPKEIAERKIRDFNALLMGVPEALANIDLEQPPSVRIAAALKYFENLDSQGPTGADIARDRINRSRGGAQPPPAGP
jgi:hypothetical protein